MIFHENRLLADDSQMFKNLLSVAAVIGALRLSIEYLAYQGGLLEKNEEFSEKSGKMNNQVKSANRTPFEPPVKKSMISPEIIIN